MLPPAVADALRADPPLTSPDRAPDPLVDALTPRELEVINLIAEGLPNKTIAGKLGISEHTVKFHVNAILTKLERPEPHRSGRPRDPHGLDRACSDCCEYLSDWLHDQACGRCMMQDEFSCIRSTNVH